MKSLNEVIAEVKESIELTDTESESEGYFLAQDSLYYLKQYQKQKEMIDALPDYYELMEFWSEHHKNAK